MGRRAFFDFDRVRISSNAAQFGSVLAGVLGRSFLSTAARSISGRPTALGRKEILIRESALDWADQHFMRSTPRLPQVLAMLRGHLTCIFLRCCVDDANRLWAIQCLSTSRLRLEGLRSRNADSYGNEVTVAGANM